MGLSAGTRPHSTPRKDRKPKMPKGGRSVNNTGTNSSGNSYTAYTGTSSGKSAGYSYSNSNGSSYYNNGGGHGFYSSPAGGTKASGGQSYSTHTNYNAGTSSTKSK